MKPVSDHYRASVDPGEGNIRVFPISDEQLAGPAPVPRGVNTKFTAGICFVLCTGISVPMGHPAPYQDLIGEPRIAPIYMFGLRYSHVSYSVIPVASETALPVIATVSTRERNYDVSFVGVETVDGVETHHLGLKPLRKPKDNRLRELWVATTDYLPREAIISGNFTMAPLVDVPWTIRFSVIDGTPFVTQESTEETLYLPHRRVVRDAAISFEHISEPDGSIYGRPLIAPQHTDYELTEPQADIRTPSFCSRGGNGTCAHRSRRNLCVPRKPEAGKATTDQKTPAHLTDLDCSPDARVSYISRELSY